LPHFLFCPNKISGNLVKRQIVGWYCLVSIYATLPNIFI